VKSAVKFKPLTLNVLGTQNYTIVVANSLVERGGGGDGN